MKDLRSQLAAALGQDASPEPAPAAGGVDLLGPDAHLDDPWLERLRVLHRSIPGAPTLAPRPKLGQARQVTDQLLRSLKRSGRKGVAKDLGQLRKAFDAKRDKEAWRRTKERFGALGLSDKAYRALKQSGADAIAVWVKLDKSGDDALREMGATRLRDHLTR